MAVDQEKVKMHVRGLLEAIGEDPDREGLVETPDRVARMCEEIFAGTQYGNDEIAEKLNKTFSCPEDGSDMVIVRDIDTFSFCEHHLMLMYDMKITVAYIPKDRVIGLSKIARAAEMVCRRLQLQERIGSDLAYIIQKISGSEDVAVIIRAHHGCMAARGIKKVNSETVTTTTRGRFRTEPQLLDRVRAGY
ncbi:MAG: GTP cyclohydrolase I FolE [Anaerovoracaceae bacterium]|nr:GTP cyclohydrolase I FolE [Bacillota bacterium]MDY2671054.1 GTP cyclohydrolase I FolE [Anaerovoracaceae bacterium]